jgi:ABC-type amino acid transport substrate-binding protein
MRIFTTIYVCLLAVALPAGVAAQIAPLRLVSTVWPPFTNSAGQARVALDLVEEALKRIGASSTMVFVEEAKFTGALLSTEFDGSAAAWRDAERDKVLLYSEAYLENRLVLVGRRGAEVSARSLAELAGKRIVVVDGYSYGEAVTSGSGPVYVRSRSEEESLRRLLANEADYTLMDEFVVQYLVSHHGDQTRNRLQLGTTPLVTRTLHLAVRRDRPGAADLISRFNAELRRMIADRTYHRLLDLDWIRADVDGDGRLELISSSERVGTTEPTRGYDLFLTQPKPQSITLPRDGSRFYVGGNFYENWASVPQQYKAPFDTEAPNPSRSTASIFKFTW